MEMMPFRGIHIALIIVVLAKCNQLHKFSGFTAYCIYRSYTVNIIVWTFTVKFNKTESFHTSVFNVLEYNSLKLEAFSLYLLFSHGTKFSQILRYS